MASTRRSAPGPGRSEVVQSTSNDHAPPRRIIVFADGTGNAFSTQESNVWRLFQALDQSQPDQIARYIRGVGTSGFRPLAMLDGATGYGVPSNVRRLYKFICWNWRPGDEIWLFGFSRGAFTVRTLVGLIHHQGLMPADVSRAEMARNAMAAWRAYRATTAPRRGTLPTIWFARTIRDAILRLGRKVRGYEPHEQVEKRVRQAGRDGESLGIRFLGVFDTVEAFGVPFEELRSAIDKVAWPISFRNMQLAGNVDLARHALALDEERTSFRPVRFDPPTGQRPDIKEVWFAGVHSDVGGGYPDGALSLVPMLWMADEAESAGLRFKSGVLDEYRALATPFGPIHDSRSGVAAVYRYDPRYISPGTRLGTAPVIHHSVLEKMTLGSENYAPVALPPTALVLMPDRARVMSLGPPQPNLHGNVMQLTPAFCQAVLPQFADLDPKLPEPHAASIALTWNTVWWRRVAYFAMAVAIAAVVALPWTASVLTTSVGSLIASAASLVGRPEWGVAAWDWLTSTNSGIGSSLAAITGSVSGFIPSYLGAWVSVFVEHFWGSVAVLLIACALYAWNDTLRDLIADRAYRGWSRHANPPQPSRWIRVAAYARRSGSLRRLHRIVPETVSYAALLLMVAATVVLTSRAVMDYRSGRGAICKAGAAPVPLPAGGLRTSTDFDTAALCWNSGVLLEKGRAYTIWVTGNGPLKDDEREVGLAGVASSSAMDRIVAPLRRRWDADWFQLLGRVGRVGGSEWTLTAVDGTAPVDLDGNFDAEIDATCSTGTNVAPAKSIDECRRMDEDTRLRMRQAVIASRLRKTYVSRFTAPQSGELFLYVNDAVFALPLMPVARWSYANNCGKAEIVIQETPVPARPDVYR